MKHLYLITTLALLAGCTVGPDYARPDAPTPTSFAEASATTPTPSLDEFTRWWESFGDPRLVYLVEQSLQHNHDLRIAQANLDRARAARRAALGALLPHVGTGASASQLRNSENGPTALPEIPGMPAPEREFELFQAGFDASWEIDLFGRNRRALEAATAELEGAAARLEDTRLTLAAETARAYLELRGVQRRLAVAERNIAIQAESLELTDARLGVGLGTQLDVSQARAQLESTRAALPQLRAAERTAIYQLAVLTGWQPREALAFLEDGQALPTPTVEIPAELPGTVLARRPDVRAAEKRLHAAVAEVGVATADLYPSISLSGLFGWASRDLSGLFDTGNERWQGAAAISLPIWQGGRLRANLRAAEAGNEAALAGFEKAVLAALADVEASLSGYREAQAEVAQLQAATDAAAEAAELARGLYEDGLVDFLTVLDAEARLAEVEDRLASGQTNLGTRTVALYKALGGGWAVTDGLAAK